MIILSLYVMCCCTSLILNSDCVVIKLVHFDVSVTYGHGIVEGSDTCHVVDIVCNTNFGDHIDCLKITSACSTT